MHDQLHPVTPLRRSDEDPEREIAPQASCAERDGDMSGVHLRSAAQPRVDHHDAQAHRQQRNRVDDCSQRVEVVRKGGRPHSAAGRTGRYVPNASGDATYRRCNAVASAGEPVASGASSGTRNHLRHLMHELRSLTLRIVILCVSTLGIACSPTPLRNRLDGDWDAYLAMGSTPREGFEGWRRMAFAHFETTNGKTVGSIRRRAGQPLLDVSDVAVAGDTLMLESGGATAMRAAWHGDTLVGVMLANGAPSGRRVRLVRRASPFPVERNYELWPGAVSDSQYAVTEDTLVFMKTRDGARLASYVARPVGAGPFGVVLQRTPYRRVLSSDGRYWASRGYIFVAQHVRGRDASDGTDFGDYDTDVRDGYDAVEWAATLPNANGRVGMIGHSDEGRLAWYAAVSAPPHLAAVAPSAASQDSCRRKP